MRRAASLLGLLFLGATGAFAQTKEAELQKYQEPVYPEMLLKGQQQGNVLLAGRIDKQGQIRDLRPLAASFPGFVDPAMAAVSAWRFKPAMRDGKPVDVAVNVGVRFRVKTEKRGVVPQPILGNLPIFPADASGAKAATGRETISAWAAAGRGISPSTQVQALASAINAHSTA